MIVLARILNYLKGISTYWQSKFDFIKRIDLIKFFKWFEKKLTFIAKTRESMVKFEF